ncbi:MAG: DUF4402 domain-containing protein [Proteobacteria bacterium]|nr:DUF4402 domain-containing protein [Pseudomonadota bacterium]
MVKLFKMTVLGFAVIALSYSSAMAARTLNPNASAEVVAALAITGGDGGAGGAALNFGTIENGAAGDVTISPAGSVSTSLVHLGGHSAAGFKVVGRPGISYSVASISNTTLSGPSGSTPMVVKNFVVDGVETLVPTGDNFSVGATIEVAAGQLEGTYTGTYTVTVTY